VTATLSDGGAWLEARSAARLRRRVADGLHRARAAGTPVLVSITAELPGERDPSATVAASRRAGESWFCLEQPDRDAIAVAALGEVRTLESAGPGRFDELAGQWRALAAAALADEAPGAPGAGLVALGGFAFAPDGGASPVWSGFAPASLVVPEVSLARRGRTTWLTVNADVAPDDTEAEITSRIDRRLSELR
jgi:hypothetical protein